MEEYGKAYDLFNKLYSENIQFKYFVNKYMELGLVRFFNEEEWDKIKSQNFSLDLSSDVKEFYDLFILGYNYGSCVTTSKLLSYSYNDVDLVSGILPLIKGLKNSEKLGGHCWLENAKYIIDTSLMLIIDKSLKEDFGYQEEHRITSYQLSRDSIYQKTKEFVNDKSLKKKIKR